MAKKKEATTEREYVIPLRRECLKVPRYRRAKKAVSTVRQFICRHMRVESVRIGANLNEFIWNNGIKNVPCRVQVRVRKDKRKEKAKDIEEAEVELKGYPLLSEIKAEKDKKHKKVQDKPQKEKTTDEAQSKQGLEDALEKTAKASKDKENKAIPKAASAKGSDNQDAADKEKSADTAKKSTAAKKKSPADKSTDSKKAQESK